MEDRLKYRSLAYITSLLLIIGLFLQFDNELKQAIFDLIYHLLGITTFVFAYLWINKRIVLIGLIFSVISWNIDLITNPLIIVENLSFISMNLRLIHQISYVTSLLCLLLGFIDNFKYNYLTKEIDFSIKTTIGFLIVFTVLFQFIIRILI